MGFNAYSFLMDFAYAGAFILCGQLIRAKVGFFQQYYVPASLIAGFLGFLCGPSGFKVIPFSNQIGTYSGLLIIFVFVAMGIQGFNVSTKGWKDDAERIGSFLCFKEVAYILQYSIPILVSFYLIGQIVPGLHPGFGMILGAGFAGGHGTAAAVGSTFAKFGWADATDLAMTSATVGILTGVFGGMILIKWATRKGITNYITDFRSLPPELKTGLVPEEKREPMGKETISGISLDSFAFHLSLVLVPVGIGRLLSVYLSKNFGLHAPSFSVAFLVALAFSIALAKMGAKQYVDRKVISRIAGSATDFLIFFGLSSIKLTIIIKYALPLSLLLVFGIVFITSYFLYFAPKMMKKDWFERGIFCFGYLTGVYAIGFVLVRIVDPEMRSKTIEDTALLAPVSSSVDIMVVSLGPILLSTGKLWTFAGAALVYFSIFLVLAIAMKWWYSKLPLARKESSAL